MLIRIRRESRARGRSSERGGSGVAVGLADGLAEGPMVGDPEANGEAVVAGVCVANGPTHPATATATTTTPPSATRNAATPRRPVEPWCGIVALDLRRDAPDGGPLGHGTGGEPVPWIDLEPAEECPGTRRQRE